MYIAFIHLAYGLFTACATLAGMLASDPEGALLFVSTFPLPLVSKAMNLAPALIKYRLEYVVYPLGLFKISAAASSSKSLPLASRIFSDPADLPEDYWYRHSPNTPNRFPPASVRWDASSSPFAADFLRELWYPAKLSPSSKPSAKPKRTVKPVVTKHEDTSLAVRMDIKSIMARIPAFMVHALVSVVVFFSLRVVLLIAYRIPSRNHDSYGDMDGGPNDMNKMDGSQPGFSPPYHATVVDTTGFDVSIPPTAVVVNLAGLSVLYQDPASVIGESSSTAASDVFSDTRELFNDDTSAASLSALLLPDTTPTNDLEADVLRKPMSRSILLSDTVFIDGTDAGVSVSGAIPTQATLDGEHLSLFRLSQPVPTIQDIVPAIGKASSKAAVGIQEPSDTNPLGVDFPALPPTSSHLSLPNSTELHSSTDGAIVQPDITDAPPQVRETELSPSDKDALLPDVPIATSDTVLVEFRDSSGQAITISLGAHVVDRGAITPDAVDAQDTPTASGSSATPTRTKRFKPTKSQRMARKAAHVYDIVLPFDDLEDLTEAYGRAKISVRDIKRACAAANELCRQRRSILGSNRVPYVTR